MTSKNREWAREVVFSLFLVAAGGATVTDTYAYPGRATACRACFYASITSGQLTVEALMAENWQRVGDLVLRYADMRLGGTDASLIALAERHRQRRIAALNTRHFRAERPAHTDAFTP